jgi:hypothetical protein
MECVIFGAASSYTGDVVDLLGRLGWAVAGFVDNDGSGEVGSEFAPALRVDDLEESWLSYSVVIPRYTPGTKPRP